MSYISSSLAFYNTKIVVEDDDSDYNGQEVMMTWEDPIMSASAAYITQDGGDILEIGFGMGIASGYIHSHSISSHTIVENHPQIIPKAITWANGKSNVTIISQSYQDVTGSLGRYDGIFYDAFGDENVSNFSSSLSSLTKSGTKVTFYWSNEEQNNVPDTPPITSFQSVNVTPTADYFSGSIYHMPKVEF